MREKSRKKGESVKAVEDMDSFPASKYMAISAFGIMDPGKRI